MEMEKIEPQKITKPIQLLASWIIGLISIDFLFLFFASKNSEDKIALYALILASIINVSAFLFLIYKMQTKFRAEMQEDYYYMKYFEITNKNTGKSEIIAEKIHQNNDSDSEEISKSAVKIEAEKIVIREPQIYSSENNNPISARIPSIPASRPPIPLRRPPARVVQNLSINDLLPEYKKIMDNLKKSGILPAENFGSSSPGASNPDPFVISFGYGFNLKILKTAIRCSKNEGLQFINLTQEEYSEKKIYIGAYGYGDDEIYLATTPDLIEKILNKDFLEKDLISLFNYYN